MKKISDQKSQAFSGGGAAARPLSRREIEEQKKKEEEEAAAHVFQEFVETFQEAPCKTSKVWVKAGTYDAGARKEDTTERGKLYKPQSRLAETEKMTSAERTQEYMRLLASKSADKPSRRKDKDKKKSNLELFKEELRQIQEEREERHKYKGALKGVLVDGAEPAAGTKDDVMLNGSFDYGDPTTTNLYLGNLNPKVSEQQLMEIFGRYGPLASIKIMWPRSEEEKARCRNCGFVAYMSRRDGERALRNLNGKEVLQYEMKMGWGKSVVIPPHPIYIPPTMQDTSLLLAPPPSGLPFNAQPPRHLYHKIPRLRPGEAFPSDPEEKETFDKILSQSIVKVVIPKERHILMLIHRMIEFVIREGPMFEAMIMNKQLSSKSFRFLFENQSTEHVYYRWKLFSLLQGDSPNRWSPKEFRMFKGGSIWRPPVMNVYTQGMPEELIEEDEAKDTRGTLSKAQRERLEELIRQLSPEQTRVGEAMVFCMEHAEAAEEIADCLAEALSVPTTVAHKKVARVYLLSDILHNTCVKLANASYFRKALEVRLMQIMRDLYDAGQRMESRLQADGFRMRVLCVLQAWEDWAVYPRDFIQRLRNMLDGQETKEPEVNMYASIDFSGEQEDDASGGDGEEAGDDGDGDGEEGGPLDGAALLKAAQNLQLPFLPLPQVHTHTDDIDGMPIDDDIDGIPLDSQASPPDSSFSVPAAVPGFVPSRWESVEPGAVEAGAVTTQRWGELAPPPATPDHDLSPDNNDSSEVTDERRMLLRSVELRAMQYQDELEGGQRQLKPGWSLAQQMQHYRRKLIKKAEREAKEKDEAIESPELAPPPDKKPHREKERERERDRERERESRSARSGSSEDGYNTSNSSSRKSKRSRDVSASPPQKRSRLRSRSPVRSSKSSRVRRPSPSPSPPPAPQISRRRDASPPAAALVNHRRPDSARKHKHKHKY